MSSPACLLLALAVLLGHTLATPLTYYEGEGRPLAVVSELGQRLASRSRLQEPGDARLGLPARLDSADARLGLPARLDSADARLGLPARLDSADARLGLPSRLESADSRLGLPSLQEIDAIKKVAQILVMLGEQVIPTIVGDLAPPAHATAAPVEDAPNDPVSED